VAFNYRLKATLSAEEEVRSQASLKTLIDVRCRHSKPRSNAAFGERSRCGPRGSAGVRQRRGEHGQSQVGVDIKVAFGLGCAVSELPKVKAVIDSVQRDAQSQRRRAGKIKFGAQHLSPVENTGDSAMKRFAILCGTCSAAPRFEL